MRAAIAFILLTLISTTIFCNNTVEIYYKSKAEKVFANIRTDNNDWKDGFNGALLENSMMSGGYKYVSVEADKLEINFYDDLGKKDTNNNVNYIIDEAGSYIIENGMVLPIEKNFIEIHYKEKQTQDEEKWGNIFACYNCDDRGWTTTSGIEMRDSKVFKGYKTITIPAMKASMWFNDGEDGIDNNNGSNYNIVGAGVYKIDNGNVQLLTPSITSKKDVIAISYNSNGKNSYISYNANGRGWTPSFGVTMRDSICKKGWKYIVLPATKMEFVFYTDNVKDGGKNGKYTIIQPGAYSIENGIITDMGLDLDTAGELLPIEAKENFGMLIEKVQINGYKALSYKKTASNKFQVNVTEKDAKAMYSIKFSPYIGNTLYISNSNGTSTVKYDIVKEDVLERWVTWGVKFNKGKNIIEIKEETKTTSNSTSRKKAVPMTKTRSVNALSAIIDNSTPLSVTPVEEVLTSDVKLLTMGVEKKVYNFRTEWQTGNWNYEKYISYDMWIDFELSKTSLVTAKNISLSIISPQEIISELPLSENGNKRFRKYYYQVAHSYEKISNLESLRDINTTIQFKIFINYQPVMDSKNSEKIYNYDLYEVTKQNIETTVKPESILTSAENFINIYPHEYIGWNYLDDGTMIHVFEVIPDSGETIRVDIPFDKIDYVYYDGYYNKKGKTGSIELKASTNIILSDGKEKSTITAVVKDKDGKEIPGQTVDFYIDGVFNKNASKLIFSSKEAKTYRINARMGNVSSSPVYVKLKVYQYFS